MCVDPSGSKTAAITKTDPVTNDAIVAFVSDRVLAGYKYACSISGAWDTHGFSHCNCLDDEYWAGTNGCMTKPGNTTVKVWLSDVSVSKIKSECIRLGGTYDDSKYLCNHPTKTFVVRKFTAINSASTDYAPTFGMIDNDTLNNYKLMCSTSGVSWRRSAGVSYCWCMSESRYWDENVGCAINESADWEEYECEHVGTFDSGTRACRCNNVNKYGVVEHAVMSYYHTCQSCSSVNAIYMPGIGLDGVCKKCPDKVDVVNNTCVTSCKSGQKYITNESDTVHLCVPASYSGSMVN